jgi:hypothetical protein
VRNAIRVFARVLFLVERGERLFEALLADIPLTVLALDDTKHGRTFLIESHDTLLMVDLAAQCSAPVA